MQLERNFFSKNFLSSYWKVKLSIRSQGIFFNLKEVTPKSLLLPSPIASKHSGFFLSSKFQPLKCLLSWRNLSQKKRLQMPPFWNCTWQPGRVYVMSFHSTCIMREGEKPATDYYIFSPGPVWISTSSLNGPPWLNKVYFYLYVYLYLHQNVFFPSDYPLHYLQCYHFLVWSMFGSK